MSLVDSGSTPIAPCVMSARMMLAVAYRVMSFACVLLCARAAAQPPRLTQQEELALWKRIDPAYEGGGVMALNGELGVLDRNAAGQLHRTLGAGFTLDVMWRPNRWPVLIGFSAGAMFFQASTRQTPNGTAEDAMELRHGELVLRVQPWRGLVRPYLDGELGGAGLLPSTVVRDLRGPALSDDQPAGVSYLTGFGLGVELKLLEFGHDLLRRWELLARLGTKYLVTGPMEFASHSESSFTGRSLPAHRLHLWQSFVSLVIGFSTRPRPLPSTPIEHGL